MADSKETSKSPVTRVKRVPVNGRAVLPSFQKEPGYQYRFVNDVDDRIERFEEGGWEMVPAEAIRRSAKRVNAPTPEGSSAQVSVGQGVKAYLMKQKDDFYNEDQAAKQEIVDQGENAMKADALKGRYGKIEVTRD